MRLHLATLFFIISPLCVFSSEVVEIGSNHHLVNDLKTAKFRISQLEVVLKETIEKVDAKNIYLEERESLIQDAENKIHDLESALLGFESQSSLTLVQKRIKELEEEVKLLWAALRTTNFELHILEDKARAAEAKVKAKAFEVKQMVELVTEQWIQVQHLEQMREFNNRRHHIPSRCLFLKFMSDIRGAHLVKIHEAFDIHWKGKKVLSIQPYLTQTLSWFKSLWSAITKYHHQLQSIIKDEMQRNELTAALANKEVVFFMASALITFPVFGAWILLSS